MSYLCGIGAISVNIDLELLSLYLDYIVVAVILPIVSIIDGSDVQLVAIM